MAKSKPTRKKKPTKMGKKMQDIIKHRKDLKDILVQYDEQSQNLRRMDAMLRVTVHRIRAILLKDSHPDLVRPILGDEAMDFVISDETKDEISFNLFGYTLTRNEQIRQIKAMEQGPLEKVRALYHISKTRTTQQLQELKDNLPVFEQDVVTTLMELTAIQSPYIEIAALPDALKATLDDRLPEYKALVDASTDAYARYIDEINQSDDNYALFVKAERELEDLVIESWASVKDDYLARIQAQADAEKEAEQAAVIAEEVTEADIRTPRIEVEHEVEIDQDDEGNTKITIRNPKVIDAESVDNSEGVEGAEIEIDHDDVSEEKQNEQPKE